MFMLRSVSKYLFGDSSKESIVEVPQGQLYLVRPLSVKGYSELIFKDAAASIRRTGQEFQYQLVVQRAYEEGEEELFADEDGDEGAGEGLGAEKDEKVFLLDESLHFRTTERDTGETVFAWRDLSGDSHDLWEFVCDKTSQPQVLQSFQVVALQCQYERKYSKSHEHASDRDLQRFSFVEEPVPNASPLASPQSISPHSSPLDDSGRAYGIERQTMTKKEKGKGKAPQREETATVPPPPTARREGREILANETAELHLFDFQSSSFMLQDSLVRTTVSETGNWDYWLQINGKERDWIGQQVVPEMNPVFNFEFLSFIFNHFTEDGSAYSWLLRFKDQETLERFQEGLMQALWEHLNETKWLKATKTDQDYVMEAFQDLSVKEREDEELPDEDEEEEEEADDGQHSEHYDSDESADDVNVRGEDDNINSQLAVGTNADRTFVVRGSKIGVFKHTADNQLQFSTNISKVQTPKGTLFNPKKVMLHAQDTDMILQRQNDPNVLYRMDLNRGTVVDEWKIHDDIAVKNFAPEKKFAQRTGEQTFLGLSDNSLYRIDPRLSGNKLVDSQMKTYASKVDFSTAATTRDGYIAAASNKGSIRLFDRLGIRAKTEIPALGDPIIGLDVSADGRWVLATTKTYLLLIDAEQKTGANEGKLGFEKSFAKDAKPQPKRLALSPSHVAQFFHETKTSVSFTPAKFNIDESNDETTIITATGPFVVSWSMKKVLENRKDPYSIRRYSEDVMADDFKFGSDKNLIVALPNQVNMIAKKTLKRPTRDSIMNASDIRGGRRSTPRKSRLSRNEIVNSPY